jgi:DNA polymerase-3 subunit delta'
MIIGHQKIRNRLAQSIDTDTCIQTYLFIGPESVGKFEVAKEFALQMIRDNHPEKQGDQDALDLFVLKPEQEVEKGVVKERDISTERTREALRWLADFPYAAKKKVLIIRDAHRLTESAQNSLLKTLEEPPVYAVIMLVTHELGKILPTTLSRCQQVAFQLVPRIELSEGIVQHLAGASLPVQYAFLIDLGRPGLVIQSLGQEVEFKERLLMLENLLHLSEKPLRERLTLSELYVKNMMQTLQLLMWWVGGLHMQASETLADESVSHMRSIEKIEKLRTDLKRFPSSARLVLDAFFLQW